MSKTTSHEISLQTAIEMTTLYRAGRPSNFPICETFEVDAISNLLATQGCTYLRIYYGMKANGEVDAILVAADADNKDILPPPANQISGDEPPILEDGIRCPPACPPPSPLNGE